uniref:PIN domain-containing protein n=1 Tax=Candidatus Kentrum sp. FW TaxID=2126338 RepID=A0A450T857_9GAMM|nr:MAG: hypothetical protein BECKFW1821A_GA0114235_10729 [Candidatus Kentron sp. FW]VFJ62826.1 MAG: hypothetical protein BECKFW1821B_GA0114236_10779 [Candidatus Kentron sp. FW]
MIVAAHQQITREWWETALPCCQAFVSPIVIQEAGRGDPNAATRRLGSIANFPVLEVTEDVNTLAGEYFARTRIPEKARADTFHLSLATTHGMDYLISWNFTHILGRAVRRVVQDINTIHGLETPVICTPEEAMEIRYDNQ